MTPRFRLWTMLLGAMLMVPCLLLGQPLTGTKIIGGTGTPDYPTLSAAITDLNSKGASGTVTFLINADLAETGSPSITTSTLSGANALVIKPNTGKTPTITFTGCVSTATSNAYSGLTIDASAAGVGNVTIDGSNSSGTTKDLTFRMNDGSNGRYCINAVGNADNIVVKNCRFYFDAVMDQSVSANRGAAIRTNGTSSTATVDSVVIQNNDIGTSTQAAGYGILISNAASTYSTKVHIVNNVVFGTTVAINTLRANNTGSTMNISGNTVSLIGFDTPAGYSEYGIWLDNSSATVNITNNKVVRVNGYNNSGIAYPLYGIFIGRQSAGSTVNVANNFISNFSWHGTDKTLSNIFGIYLAGTTASTYNIYYNTVYLNGDSLDGNTSSIIAFNVANANSAVNLKNNIIVNTADVSTAFAVGAPTTTALISDYNDLYCGGSTANVGTYNAVAQNTLAAWKTASGQDAHSINVNPANPFGAPGQLKSVTDLHWVSTASKVFAGTPIADYSKDIDGDTRNVTMPYMGADEAGPLTGVKQDDNAAPFTFALDQNYPNPFNPLTVVSYQLPVASQVKLAVYDLLGRKVAVLVNGEMEAGSHTVRFDATGLSSGVYFYRLTSGERVETRRMQLMK